MDKHVLFDELHLTLLVPTDLEDAACDSIRRIRDSRTFRTELRLAIRQLFRHYPDLAIVRLQISS
jgi:hypothetical protein